MEVLRELGQFKLNKGDGMSRGLYNITNGILLDYTKKKGCSYWFGEETKDLLMACDTNEFLSRAKQYAGNDIYCKEVEKNYRKEVDQNIKDGIVTANMVTPFGGVFSKGDTLEEVNQWFNQMFRRSTKKKSER